VLIDELIMGLHKKGVNSFKIIWKKELIKFIINGRNYEWKGKGIPDQYMAFRLNADGYEADRLLIHKIKIIH
jgi:hypothetical protein